MPPSARSRKSAEFVISLWLWIAVDVDFDLVPLNDRGANPWAGTLLPDQRVSGAHRPAHSISASSFCVLRILTTNAQCAGVIVDIVLD